MAARATCPAGVEPYDLNHVWRQARPYALLSQGSVCGRCHSGPGAEWLVVALTGRRIDHDTVDVDVEAAWWAWTSARLQVHHQEPLWGRREPVSCQHHQAGLVLLCTECHKAETARWRRVRWALIRAFGVDLADRDQAERAA